MPKVTIVQVIYNSRKYIPAVFESIFNQTFKDFNVVVVIAGNEDGGKELLKEKFPQVEIIDPGYNIGFAKGHNLVFSKYDSEFFQLVNPDLILKPNYIEEMLKVFDDPKVGAATGKLLQYDFTRMTLVTDKGHPCLDTTGVTISKSGRARDRGQHEVDTGQYDGLIAVDAVSAASAMYRRSALEKMKILVSTTPSANAATPPLQAGSAPAAAEAMAGKPQISVDSPPSSGISSVKGGVPRAAGGGGMSYEYFDKDFHSYWEDIDLAWRMTNAGWKCAYVPSAVGYHGRGAGSSRGGYLDIVNFIKHHRTLSPRIRQLNYQNHIFMYIKNSRWFYPQFFVREFFMFFYVLIFETNTLKVLPRFFKLLPKMWKKRKLIKVLRYADVSKY